MPPRCLNALTKAVTAVETSSLRASFSTSTRMRVSSTTPGQQSDTSAHGSIEKAAPGSSANLVRRATHPERAARHIQNMIKRSEERRERAARTGPSEASQSAIESLTHSKLANGMGRSLMRRYQQGNVYAPHDMSPSEMSKWRHMGRPEVDLFDMLALNPKDMYCNFSVMSEYVTDTGRIKSHRETGLRGVNQRRLAKAIRRSIGLGLMPSTHRHPEILMALDIHQREKTSRM